MLRNVSFCLVLFIGACSADTPLDADSDPKVVRLTAADECDDPIEVCTASEPPTCNEYCAEDPGPGGEDEDCVVSSEGDVSCNDEPCIVNEDSEGDDIVTCPGEDCVVNYDSETDTESIYCPPGGSDDCPNPDDDGGCSVPGGPPGGSGGTPGGTPSVPGQ